MVVVFCFLEKNGHEIEKRGTFILNVTEGVTIIYLYYKIGLVTVDCCYAHIISNVSTID